MLLDLDLSATTVLIAGPSSAAEWAGKRVECRAAKIIRVTTGDDVPEPGGLLVDVTDGSDDWAPTIARLTAGRAVIRLTPPPAGGRIVLVGGGPGDPALQTVRAREELFAADVVFTDRLATHDDHDLVRAAAPAARVVDVGKLPGFHRVPQHEISRLLVEEARAGNYVVRLKGGDPFVFGRGGEEVAAAREAGVPVTVVPGITSAISVPGAAGVPVTHREVTRAFTVMSGHHPFTEAEYRHLVGLGGTIVVLMGVGTFVQCISGLLRAGLDPVTPFVVIERGFTSQQREIRGVACEAAEKVTLQGVTSPAVIVIGEVADLPDLR